MLTPILVVFGLAAMEKALLLLAAITLGVTAAVGIYEAWTKKRGIAGWIVNVVASVIGGAFGGSALGTAVVLAAGLVAKPLGPDLAGLDALVGLFATIVGLLLGSWVALAIVNRFR